MKIKEKMKNFYNNTLEEINWILINEESKDLRSFFKGTMSPLLVYKDLFNIVSEKDNVEKSEKNKSIPKKIVNHVIVAGGILTFIAGTSIAIENYNRDRDSTIEAGDDTSYIRLNNASHRLKNKYFDTFIRFTTPLGNVIQNYFSNDVFVIPSELSDLENNLYTIGDPFKKTVDGFSLDENLDDKTFYFGTHNENNNGLSHLFDVNIILSDDEIKQGLEKSVKKLNYNYEKSRQEMLRQKNRSKYKGQFQNYKGPDTIRNHLYKK